VFARSSDLRWRDRLAIFFGYETQRRTAAVDSSISTTVDRNPDLRARRFLLLAVLLAQLANVADVKTSVAIVGLVATVVAFFIRQAPRKFIWRSALLALTFAAGAVIFLSYGKLIGRDSGISLLFIFGPLKLIEARSSRDYMWVWGLGLVLYVASFFENIGLAAALTLPLVIIAYIAALRLFDARADESGAPSIVSHVKSAAVHTLMGIPLAAMLFILFPRATAPLWGMRDPSTAQTGLSEEMQPGEIANLIRSREIAFRAEFEGRKPPKNALYWRGPVLRQFDGVRWSAGDTGQRGEFVAITPEEIEREGVVYTVTAERLDTRWLPVLEVPAAFPTGPAVETTAFLTDAQQIGIRRASNTATAYRVQSVLRPNYSGDEKKSPFFELQTGSRSFNPRARAFAAQLREQYANPTERVRALLGYFNREQFFYTLNPPLYSDGANRSTSIDRFLFDGRRGFCEHYAGATVFLLRASGIPARVVTGYQGGEWHPSGYLVVRQSDAHAWAEALIDGVWNRIDPTAAVAPNRIELGLSESLPETERLLMSSRRWFETAQLTALWENANFSYTKWVIGFDRDRQKELLRDLGLQSMSPLTALGWMLIAVSLSGGIVALGWWIMRRRDEKKHDPSVQLWHTLRKRLVKAGLKVESHETVAQALSRAAARWPQYAAAFAAFTRHYETNRFAKPTSDVESVAFAALKQTLHQLPRSASLRRSAHGAKNQTDAPLQAT
jgi:protein-glutamine gamma-glutamyltransferase